MDIVVAFSKNNNENWVSELIMLFQDKPYSHVLMIYDCPDEGIKKVFQATGKGVHTVSLDKFLLERTVVAQYGVQLSCSQDRFAGIVEGSDGKGYGHMQYIGFLLPFLRKYFDNNKKQQICSELVARILNKWSKYNVVIDEDFVTPEQIEDVLLAIPKS